MKRITAAGFLAFICVILLTACSMSPEEMRKEIDSCYSGAKYSVEFVREAWETEGNPESLRVFFDEAYYNERKENNRFYTSDFLKAVKYWNNVDGAHKEMDYLGKRINSKKFDDIRPYYTSVNKIIYFMKSLPRDCTWSYYYEGLYKLIEEAENERKKLDQ